MIAFDTETTGLIKPEACDLHLQPEITEIYLAKFDWDGNIIDEFETFIKPTLPIPEEITKITGITDDHVRSAPRFIEVYKSLSDFLIGETHIFAHNCPFDIGMLKYELRRNNLEHNFPWPPNHMCTVELSFPINNKRMKLKDLYNHVTGLDIEGAHRARNDVQAMIKCIVWLKQQGFIKD